MARNCGDDGGSRCKHLCSQDNMELSSFAIYGNGFGFKVMAFGLKLLVAAFGSPELW